jgi:hypothetical protein
MKAEESKKLVCLELERHETNLFIKVRFKSHFTKKEYLF